MTAPSSSGATGRRLGELLRGYAPVNAADDREISGLALDSRRIVTGDLFFACAGSRTHGIEFVNDAVNAGACAILVDADDAVAAQARVGSDRAVPLIGVRRLAEHLGPIAARFYDEPSRAMTMIGVTGTNGKTSCCHFIAQALTADGDPCGVIGTMGYGRYGALTPGDHTTPDALTLQRELARMRDAAIGRVAMEVSSHALEQGRTNGVAFTSAVFTNLSHEHLDYHGDLAAYGRAKKRLFAVPGLRFAVINHDDAFGRELIAGIRPPVTCVRFGLEDAPGRAAKSNYVCGQIRRMTISGLELGIRSSWGDGELRAPLLGRFNAENLLAVLAVLLVMEVPLTDALRRLGGLRAVPGRMERFGGEGERPLVIVDYAHTPDALEQTLSALRSQCPARLWCVFGCGGERDRAKRPLMGAVAGRYADHIILTNDNPRGEEPRAIIEEILLGVPAPDAVEVIPDRARAIRRAVAGAAKDDIVLIAGKGHEDYQLIGNQRRSFSDRLQVRALLEGAA